MLLCYLSLLLLVCLGIQENASILPVPGTAVWPGTSVQFGSDRLVALSRE